MLLKYCTQYTRKLGKLRSDHKTGKYNFSFQSQRKAMPKNVQTTVQLHCLTCYQSYAQNPSCQASTVFELKNSRCTSWIQKRQRNQRSNCQHPLDHRKSKGISKKEKKKSTSASSTMLKPLTVWITTNWNILNEMRLPDHLTCLLRNLYA